MRMPVAFVGGRAMSPAEQRMVQDLSDAGLGVCVLTSDSSYRPPSKAVVRSILDRERPADARVYAQTVRAAGNWLRAGRAGRQLLRRATAGRRPLRSRVRRTVELAPFADARLATLYFPSIDRVLEQSALVELGRPFVFTASSPYPPPGDARQVLQWIVEQATAIHLPSADLFRRALAEGMPAWKGVVVPPAADPARALTIDHSVVIDDPDGDRGHLSDELSGLADPCSPATGGPPVFVSLAGSEHGDQGLVDAMAQGCAVVARARPGVLELVTPGVDGLVVDDRDLVAAVERLLERPEQAAAMGRAAEARVTRAPGSVQRSAALRRLFSPDRSAS